jgi:hypothetical protein
MQQQQLLLLLLLLSLPLPLPLPLLPLLLLPLTAALLLLRLLLSALPQTSCHRYCCCYCQLVSVIAHCYSFSMLLPTLYTELQLYAIV